MHYFAYGSNMNHKLMEKRCPGSHFIKPVYLEHAKFVYDGKSSRWEDKAVANIISCDNARVWGGLFQISQLNLDSLDVNYEGFPKHYGRGMVKVKDIDGEQYDAWVYYRVGQKQGSPSEEYRHIVIQGARDCSLPEDYIKNNL
jgi:gamma-glutamylcyclotransferase (GGCT)/AIG2-like uncharacterized protein YtfP